jgi:hypothetical protein
MAKRVPSDEERAQLEALVADLQSLIAAYSEPLPADATAGDMDLLYDARFDVMRATHAVSSAAAGSAADAMERARAALDTARDAIRTVRTTIDRSRS